MMHLSRAVPFATTFTFAGLVLACDTTAPTSAPVPVARPAPSAVVGNTPVGRLALATPFVSAVPSTTPLLQAGTPRIDLAQVERAMTAQMHELDSCYQEVLAAAPKTAGRIVIHGNITADGTVSEQCITEDSIAHPTLVACVNAVLADAQLPAPIGGDVDVTFPFEFSVL